MRLIIENKSKLEAFVSIFQLLKNWSSHISMHFEKDKLYIQSMDKSHICLADIEIKDKWFSEFDCLCNNKISVDSNHFAILMNYALKHDKLELKYEDENDPDKLYINFLNEKEKKGSFNHFFELNLFNADEDNLGIPKLDYDVEFTIEAKKLVEVFAELNTFGQDLHIKCSENVVELNSHGDSTKLKINIPVDDLDEYAISEGEEISMSFSLSHLCKMCLSIKLCSTINVSLNGEYPMSLIYNLGDDSKVAFYIAPKISDN
jgi:proliferating cell nuclear antigen PCNA